MGVKNHNKNRWDRLVTCTRCGKDSMASRHELVMRASGVKCQECGGNMIRKYPPSVQPYGQVAPPKKKTSKKKKVYHGTADTTARGKAKRERRRRKWSEAKAEEKLPVVDAKQILNAILEKPRF